MTSSPHAAQVARRIWTLVEPVHAVTYFSPEARSAFESAGLRGFWRGYFAGRSAPLGRVDAAPVIASFFNFAPSMVKRALPAVWDLVSPQQALAAREAGAVAALGRLLAGCEADVARAADLLITALHGVDCAGRVLASANAALPVPVEPLARLWQGATLLREHRGDAHFAALLAADIDGCEILALRELAPRELAPRESARPRSVMQPIRGWTDGQWDAAAARLTERGLLGSDGTPTESGAALLADIEHRTDAAAARPWRDEALAAEVIEVITPIGLACAADLPYPNPIGVQAVRAVQ
jgi:hypothetical protein